MAERLLPHDEGVERALIGSLLIDDELFPQVQGILTEADFYDARYRGMYEAAQAIGPGLDPVTLIAELRRRGTLEKVGGEYFVVGCMTETMVSLHGLHYAGIVRALSQRRQLVQLGSRLVQTAFAPEDDESVEDIISDFGGELLQLLARGTGECVTAEQAAEEVREKVAYWAVNPLPTGEVRGLSSGLRSVDQILNGMQGGDLILVAARPSMGKSALGFEIARRVGAAGGRVLIFSLEMGRQQVVGRWASALSAIHSTKVERGVCPADKQGTRGAEGYLSGDELQAYYDALDAVSGYGGLVINDQAGLRAEQIRAVALSQAAIHGGLDLVVIDHTGLMETSPGENQYSSAKREGAKSRRMKALAKELGAPVVLMQQLSRGLEARANKRPALADLRDSGEHEENADVVVGLYSEQYYKVGGGAGPDKLEVLCLKHRNGHQKKRVSVRYERPLSKFTEFSYEQEGA